MKATTLPPRVDSNILMKHAKPGEPIVILKGCDLGTTGPFEFRDTGTRWYVFRWELKYGGHVLRIPLDLYSECNYKIAHEILNQRRLPFPIVTLLEVPAPQMGEPEPKGVDTLGGGGDSTVPASPAPVPPPVNETVVDETQTLPDAIAALVKDGPVRMKEVCDTLACDKDMLRECVADCDNLEIASGGWVRIKEPEPPVTE